MSGEIQQVAKWRVKRAKSGDGWWARHPDHASEDRWFRTHGQAHEHVRAQQIAEAVKANPAGALMAAMGLMAQLEKLKSQQEQLNDEENDGRRDDGGSARGDEEAGEGEADCEG